MTIISKIRNTFSIVTTTVRTTTISNELAFGNLIPGCWCCFGEVWDMGLVEGSTLLGQALRFQIHAISGSLSLLHVKV